MSDLWQCHWLWSSKVKPFLLRNVSLTHDWCSTSQRLQDCTRGPATFALLSRQMHPALPAELSVLLLIHGLYREAERAAAEKNLDLYWLDYRLTEAVIFLLDSSMTGGRQWMIMTMFLFDAHTTLEKKSHHAHIMYNLCLWLTLQICPALRHRGQAQLFRCIWQQQLL